VARAVESGRRPAAIAFFAATAWDGNRFPDQHMAERLARKTPVLYVDPPLSVLRTTSGLRGLVSPRIERLTPTLTRVTSLAPPFPHRAFVRNLSHATTRRGARVAARRLGVDVQTVVVASLSPLLDAFPGARRVLYGTDDFAAGAALMSVSQSWLNRREIAQLRSADVVVSVSETLADKWRGLGHPTSVVPNGCDFDHFAQADDSPWPDDVELPGPIAGFVGHMSERIDFSILERVAETGSSLLLVGPRQSTCDWQPMERLLSRPNVQWVGPKPFEQLPSYVRAINVGLVPYADSAFNRGSFPLKTLEYLAAGRPTVATDLPAIRWLDTPTVSMAKDPSEFSHLVVQALSQRPEEKTVAAMRAVAERNSWDLRAREFADLLGLSPDSATDGAMSVEGAIRRTSGKEGES